jgi:hypothetical protein
MKKSPTVKRVPYSVARPLIKSGDLLSFRPRCSWYRPWSYWTWLIALTNPGRICHSAMAAWWGNNLLVVQMTASPDRIVLLSDYVKKWPGSITVSRPITDYTECIPAAVERMVRITEQPYGWMRILLLGIAHTFTGGLLYPNVPDDERGSKWPPVCSESYSKAMRLGAGFDPCLDRPDCRTEPHHLYESDRLLKLFTPI